ncbi:restriction endonuclease [Mucilaginibacter sp. AW1-3]
METFAFGNKFEQIIERMLRSFNFKVEPEVRQTSALKRFVIDLLVERNQSTTLIEVKFYRSKKGVANAVRNAAEQLKRLLTAYKKPASGLLIIAAYSSQELRDELANAGILLWDRSDIYNLIKFGLADARLLENFEQLLNEAKQGLDTEEVFADVILTQRSPDTYFAGLETPFRPGYSLPPPPGRDYCGELNAIPPGQPGWRDYELKCIEILRYLFEDDLNNWHTQTTTDDAMSRFDMICRIVSANDFWRSLIQSFQSRYVLFEFKNYVEPIGQDQIYTTERYLYLRGLRSVAFIITRNGGSERAVNAAKGALREHGKLILILANKDLCEMLRMKAEGKVPTDYLSDKLDDFLITLSR